VVGRVSVKQLSNSYIHTVHIAQSSNVQKPCLPHQQDIIQYVVKISVLRCWRWANVCPKHVELILEINKTVTVASSWCSIFTLPRISRLKFLYFSVSQLCRLKFVMLVLNFCFIMTQSIFSKISTCMEFWIVILDFNEDERNNSLLFVLRD
jgi:hypothetical protein